jgi:pimeloyl-ACP methyl ester carboxylesterase
MTQAEELQGLLSDARVEVVPGAAHRPHLEDPSATAALISEFLSAP